MPLSVVDLRCEGFSNPLGIEAQTPRLSWRIESNEQNVRQAAYRVRVYSSRDALDRDQPDLWDSGRVETDQSLDVRCGGPPLSSRQMAFWTVEVWDATGEQAQSEPGAWEMGLLSPGDWVANWIGGRLVGGPQTPVPCPFLRTEFDLKGGAILSARLYVTALGLYEMRLNGRKVGDELLSPGWTDYHKRVDYQVYDVAGLLQEGPNALGAVLGDGWYCGHVEWRGRQRYGDRPKLRAQLSVMTAEGPLMTVYSDSMWKHAYGPILESDLLMGESYDARLEMPGWDRAGFDDSAWLPAVEFPDPGIALTSRLGPPVRAQELIVPPGEPREAPEWPHSRWIFDMGQNVVGHVRLRVSGPAGATLQLRHAEVLADDGSLYTANLRTARQVDYYTLKGGGEEVWEPRFTFHGFRYVEIKGLTAKPEPGAVTGVVVHSDIAPTGSFECSAPLINQLQHNIQWGLKGNFVSVPTDCPQRDERLGWTGDAQVFVRTAAFNRDVEGFFSEWLRTLRDSQAESGAYPPVAPDPGILSEDGGPAWADAGVICPWTLYLCYGDRGILEAQYASMARYMEFLERTARGGIRCYDGYEGFGGFGDWLSINAHTPNDLIGTAFFAHSAGLMSRIAGILGRDKDERRFENLRWTVRAAFQERFLGPDGGIAARSQTGCILALHFGLAPADQERVLLGALVEDIERRAGHLSAGFVGSSYLLPVLTRFGRLDVAFGLLNQTTWPSWLYPVTQGATTIWERWDGWTHDKGFQDPAMNSFNHYAYGAVGEWLYSVVAGIQPDADQPGYKHTILRPHPGGGLASAAAEHQSRYGLIRSAWRLEGDTIDWAVTVPPNTTATLQPPTQDVEQVEVDGKPAAEVVELTGESEGRVSLRAGSGEYRLGVRV